MDADVSRLIQAIHESHCKTVLALTGGGTSAAGLLLSVPGGSRTVLEVRVPYDAQALIEYLARRADQFCSPEVAKEMALRARERAQWLAPEERAVGVGCTASLATDRPKRGEHRFHIATQTAGEWTCYSLTLQKGARDRETEESLLDRVLVNALAKAVGLGDSLSLALLPGEELHVESAEPGDPLQAVVEGKERLACVEPDGRLRLDAPPPRLVVPGAFNPLHEGHRGLALAAERLTGHTATFELSVVNVDKPPLTVEEIRRRLHQFQWRSGVWLTRAPRFAEKSSLFPGSIFVVGADTAARILSARYYEEADTGLARALEQIRAQGCRFLVAGRVCEGQTFVGLTQLAIPEAFADLFAAIPENLFRRDISSTELRAGGAAG